MLSIELKRWLRSKKVILLSMFFVFLSISSTLAAYYANDIFKTMASTNGAKVIFVDITWESLIHAFFKNSTQMGLFVGLYLILSMNNIEKTESLKLFYLTRTKSRFKIYLPKLYSSMFFFTISWLSGLLSTIYITMIFYKEFSIDKIITTSTLHLIMLSFIIIFCFLINIIFNMPFVISGLTEILILVFSSLTMIGSFDKYTGINFLLPKKLIDYNELFNRDNLETMLYLVIYMSVLIILVWLIDVIRGGKNGH
ncbi:TPA: hypothetical protein U1C21_000274 [Streptococcus suis]|nr:hypothetical protein [Streptococcus suis]HEM3615779.1 hypothetical protein [Streptococcus suis]HEM3620642.1 hypothetical protein [Streptococcus suis]HEM3637363.1 hypothetical protein [Streptococcus suis]